jgi:membrane protein implicated in regulation of membrane protease activity
VILLITIILAVFVVPVPWNLAVLVLGILGEIGEIAWGRRLARRLHPRTGAEAMVGVTGVVASACRPAGQVRVQGELWNATCVAGADPGDTVRIEAVNGLTLVVVAAP